MAVNTSFRAVSAATMLYAALLQLYFQGIEAGLCTVTVGTPTLGLCANNGCTARGGACKARDSSGNLHPQGSLWDDCVCVSNGNVIGDPHVVGFSGHKFMFHGYDDAVFALLSEDMHQVNVRLQAPIGSNQSELWMTGVGVRVGVSFNLTLHMALNSSAPLPLVQDADDPSVQRMVLPGPVQEVVQVSINGQDMAGLLYSKDGATLRDVAPGVIVEFPPRPNAPRYRSVYEEGDLVSVTTRDLKVTIAYSSGAKRGMPHLDVSTQLLTEDLRNMHGVLGQTTYWDPRTTDVAVEGTDADYEVADLLSTQFKYASFKGRRVAVDSTNLSRTLLGQGLPSMLANRVAYTTHE
jgi:hypothetical protein